MVEGQRLKNFIRRMTSESHGTETGGILIGFQKGIDLWVTRASDAAPKALKSAWSISRDTEHCRVVLQQEFATTGADYVGEWHTHIVDRPEVRQFDGYISRGSEHQRFLQPSHPGHSQLHLLGRGPAGPPLRFFFPRDAECNMQGPLVPIAQR
jgi:integrative and conjugative element protein (TIGR02256 family)